MDGPEAPPQRFAYQPALDGVRAVAVTAVLLFHAGVPGFDGGYVGVSVFFTLSGFLITSLLIREHRSSGSVKASAFYARRARRLLPASAVCLLAVTALSVLGAWDQVPHLRRDAWAAALQVFNWLRLTGDTSYADLFSRSGGQVSPLEHYWSLAIEEQFYWVWPVAFLGLAKLAGRGRRSLVWVLAVPAAIAVVGAPVIAAIFGPNAAYWSTPARVGEILTGAVAAAIVAQHGAPRWTRRAAPVCLLILAATVALFPAVGGPAYHGWLPTLSIVTATLLMGLQHGGPVRSGLSWRPLVALGTISYGVYLFHWPLFTLIDEQRLGRGGVVLLAARLGATLAVAIVSYRLIEQPVRRSTWAARPTLLAALALTVVLLVAALAIPNATVTFDTAGSAAADAAIIPGGPAGPVTRSSGPEVLPPDQWNQLALPTPVPTRPVRILIVGDSTAEATGGGVVRWAAANPDLAQVTIEAAPGCGFVQGGTRVFPGREEEVPPSCARYVDEVIAAKVAELRPDVVMMMTSGWDVINQRFEGTGPLAPTDDEYRRRIEEAFGTVTEAALDAGAGHVIWVAEPTVDPFWNPDSDSPQSEPERHEVLHGIMRDLSEADPDRVQVADLAWWLQASGLDTDHPTRPDGVHLSAEASERIATDWLGPLLVHASLAG